MYAVMMLTRVMFISHCSQAILRGALTSVRYAVCRRQFKTIKGRSEERKLLDYQTHMAILGQHVAAGYVIKLLAKTQERLVHQSN